MPTETRRVQGEPVGPLKVLHVYKIYLPDDFTGVPRVIHGLAEAHAAQGIDVRVFVPAREPSPVPRPVGRHHVVQVQRSAAIASTDVSVAAFRAYGDAVRDADILHYHFPWPVADLLHFAHGRGKPAIVTYHSDIVRQRVLRHAYAPLMHAFLSRMDRIVATSPNYAATSPVLARHSDRVAVIPIGIGDRPAPDAGAVAAWRARVGEGFFLFVGALRYYKGLDFLIEGARISGLPVVIAGSNAHGELDVGSLPANVTYLGVVDEADKEALLSLCRALVLPSHLRSEAFGVALLEAARAGRPMISCEIGTGTSYVNHDGETGRVVPPGDAAALAAAMRELAADPARAAQMGEAARARHAGHFTVDAMAAAYRDLYEAVLAKHGKA
jgi:glycosyltransferase involved in cell wall biosynthesis